MAKFVYDGWDFPSVKAGPPNERFLKMIMSPEIGNYQGASFLFFHIPSGSGTGTHTHTSDEIMYVTGRGESRVGDVVSKLETDSVIFAPKGVGHYCQNTSETETLKLFCVFIPSLKPSPLIDELHHKTREYLKDK